jgi:magnesium and cobalt transporter
MEKNSLKKKLSWKDWIINKLLSNESIRMRVLNFIATNEQDSSVDESEDNNEKSLIKNILNLNDITVEDVMVPRAEIVSIEKNQSIDDILFVIENESHSRMPVYDNNLDNVIGFLHIKDILKHIGTKNFELKNVIRDVLYVAPKSPILDLLKRMRSSRIHMGLIVDEFGGVNGLVTIEDLVEEIVGEIEDEHDAEDDEKLLKKINSTTILVDASFKIQDLENYFNLKIVLEDDEDDDIDTVGGMLFYIANKVPKNNQIYKYQNILQFKVIKASARRIESLEIKKIN